MYSHTTTNTACIPTLKYNSHYRVCKLGCRYRYLQCRCDSTCSTSLKLLLSIIDVVINKTEKNETNLGFTKFGVMRKVIYGLSACQDVGHRNSNLLLRMPLDMKSNIWVTALIGRFRQHRHIAFFQLKSLVVVTSSPWHVAKVLHGGAIEVIVYFLAQSLYAPPECIIMSENTNVSVACLITIPGYAESDRTANGIIWLEANVARHLNNLIERLSDIFEAQVSTISNSIFFSFFNIFYKKDFLRKLFGNACSGRRSRMQVFLGV